MLHPGVFPLLTADLSQVAVVRVGYVVGTADGIGSQRAIRGTLTQRFAAFGHDARRAPSAVGLLAGF